MTDNDLAAEGQGTETRRFVSLQWQPSNRDSLCQVPLELHPPGKPLGCAWGGQEGTGSVWAVSSAPKWSYLRGIGISSWFLAVPQLLRSRWAPSFHSSCCLPFPVPLTSPRALLWGDKGIETHYVDSDAHCGNWQNRTWNLSPAGHRTAAVTSRAGIR